LSLIFGGQLIYLSVRRLDGAPLRPLPFLREIRMRSFFHPLLPAWVRNPRLPLSLFSGIGLFLFAYVGFVSEGEHLFGYEFIESAGTLHFHLAMERFFWGLVLASGPLALTDIVFSIHAFNKKRPVSKMYALIRLEVGLCGLLLGSGYIWDEHDFSNLPNANILAHLMSLRPWGGSATLDNLSVFLFAVSLALLLPLGIMWRKGVFAKKDTV